MHHPLTQTPSSQHSHTCRGHSHTCRGHWMTSTWNTFTFQLIFSFLQLWNRYAGISQCSSRMWWSTLVVCMLYNPFAAFQGWRHLSRLSSIWTLLASVQLAGTGRIISFIIFMKKKKTPYTSNICKPFAAWVKGSSRRLCYGKWQMSPMISPTLGGLSKIPYPFLPLLRVPLFHAELVKCQCKAQGKQCSTQACSCHKQHLACSYIIL